MRRTTLTLVIITLVLALLVWADVIHYYGTGIAFGPVFVDWYYLTHGDPGVWWFPGDNA